MPRHTQQRYIKDKVKSSRVIWRADLPISVLPKGKILRIETISPAVVKWTPDNWITINDTETADMGLGIHFIDLPTDTMKKDRSSLPFLEDSNRWEEQNYLVEVAGFS
ncbi:MAG: hypothetical protein H6573_31185 [Lewinellaceae bacterium]|nr:hypothetical protein [Lewinellaceae bacterium]